MSYYKHPDVKTLEVIADNWFEDRNLSSRASSRTATPHDAQSLTRLVANSCWAVQDPYSEVVTGFLKWYRKLLDTDLQRLSNDELEIELRKFHADIDDMFFFSVLTRKVKGKSEPQRLVRLRVTSERPDGKYCGEYSLEEDGPCITMYRNKMDGRPNSFQLLLCTLVHESCHAYLYIFSDRRHPKHQEWVTKYDWHGEMFWVLFRFIARRIGVFAQSERWRNELVSLELECYDLTKTKGEPGSWGTPELTLMGGVLSPWRI